MTDPTKAPQTADELYNYCKDVFCFEMPTPRTAPFKALAEAYFNSKPITVCAGMSGHKVRGLHPRRMTIDELLDPRHPFSDYARPPYKPTKAKKEAPRQSRVKKEQKRARRSNRG